MTRTYFRDAAAFRRWLEIHHDSADELWVGYHKKASGRPSMTWPESVDQALCFGWIDGLRKSVDAESYEIRFTPRRRGSRWSAVNTRRFAELQRAGLVHPAGAAAFAARHGEPAGYSFEQSAATLAPEFERELQGNPDALTYWKSRPPGYRRRATHWVMSAKRDATRRRRMRTLIEDSAGGRPIRPLRPRGN